ERDGSANRIRRNLRLEIRGARELRRTGAVAIGSRRVAPRKPYPRPQRKNTGVGEVALSSFGRCNQFVGDRYRLVPAPVEIRPAGTIRACAAQLATEAVALGNLDVLGPGTTSLIEPGEEVQLGGEIRVARRDHLERAGSLCDLNTSLDLIKAPSVAEAAACAADDDVQTRARVVDAQFLDQRQRLRAYAKPPFDPAVRHVLA